MTAMNLNRAVRGPVTAVPIVAGKGVKLTADTQNNRWVVEADETTLFSSAAGTAMSASTAFDLSEALTNFERIRFECGRISRGPCLEFMTTGGTDTFTLVTTMANASNVIFDVVSLAITSNTRLTVDVVTRRSFSNTAVSGTTPSPPLLYRIVGINRINA